MMIANRTRELQLFQSMVQGSESQRVLLIEAKSGFGKTWLLAQFKRTLPNHSISVVIDLKSAQLGIPYIFSSVRKQLGQQRFPKLNAALQQYLLNAGIEISDTTMIGQDNQFSVVLTNVDENMRNFRLIQLREALFQDLQAIRQKLVFLFDSYEKAPTELANWIEGEFLEEVVNRHQLVVVIAGQQIPKPTIAWMDLSHCCSLEAILDQDAWYNYTLKVGLPFNQDQVGMAIRILKGQPAEIVKMLETLARGQQ